MAVRPAEDATAREEDTSDLDADHATRRASGQDGSCGAEGIVDGMLSVVWETAFVAMSLALGATEAQVRASMNDDAALRTPLLAALGSPDKRTRARALAAALAAITLDVERAEVSWAP